VHRLEAVREPPRRIIFEDLALENQLALAVECMGEPTFQSQLTALPNQNFAVASGEVSALNTLSGVEAM
jgi:hypothetical protein